MMGLRPQGSSRCHCQTILGHFQTILVIILIVIGYLLQYLFKFRRDKGYGYDGVVLNFHEIFHEGGFFIYILPSVLHFTGFLTAIYVFKIRDCEQFQGLIERVFIVTNCSKSLVANLWGYFLYGCLWLTVITTSSFLMTSEEHDIVDLDWLAGISAEDLKKILKILLICTIFIHDLVQVIIVVSYCVQCCLLRTYVYKLKERLLHHTIEPLEWMRELGEFQKFVKFLNRNLSISISVYLILNMIYALSGSVFLVKIYNNEIFAMKLMSNICNTLAWILLALVPFYQAAKLNDVCRSIRASGHQIRLRPFVHHNTSVMDLDSVILFASSLKISVKLFKIPIRGSYLGCIVVCMVIAVFTFGMCFDG